MRFCQHNETHLKYFSFASWKDTVKIIFQTRLDKNTVLDGEKAEQMSTPQMENQKDFVSRINFT